MPKKGYSIALDCLITAAAEFKRGNVNKAAKFLSLATDQEDFDDTIESLDDQNQQAMDEQQAEGQDDTQQQAEGDQDKLEQQLSSALARFRKATAGEEGQGDGEGQSQQAGDDDDDDDDDDDAAGQQTARTKRAERNRLRLRKALSM